MIHSFSKREIFLSIALIILVAILCNPFDMFIPSMFQMVVVGLLIVFVGLFTGLVVHESISDEREQFHRDQAGRVGYSAGLIVILSGIVVQSLTHVPVDGWLLGALVSMVLFKIIARAYGRHFH